MLVPFRNLYFNHNYIRRYKIKIQCNDASFCKYMLQLNLECETPGNRLHRMRVCIVYLDVFKINAEYPVKDQETLCFALNTFSLHCRRFTAGTHVLG